MGSFSVEYVSPDGVMWPLTAGDEPGLFIEMDTISGLVGEFEDTPVIVPGQPGQRVDARDRQVRPLTGGFTVVVLSRQAWVRFRRDWSTRYEGSLWLTNTDARRFMLPVRLAASLGSPGSVPGPGSRVPVSVVSDGGVWRELFSGVGQVEVTNFGEVPVWPVVQWKGDGGTVVLPSGATVELPATEQWASLPLQRSNSGFVWVDGQPHSDLSANVNIVGESVPVGESRVFTVPDGAELLWNVGVFDPWI